MIDTPPHTPPHTQTNKQNKNKNKKQNKTKKTKDLYGFQWKTAQAPKKEFPKDFSQAFAMKFVYSLHLTPHLIFQ